MPSTRIAVSDACERSAQASSSTSIAALWVPGQVPAAAVRADAARARSSSVCEEDAPGDRGAAVVRELGDRGRRVVVEEGGEEARGLVRVTTGDGDVQVEGRPALHPKMSLTRSKNGFSPLSRSRLDDLGRQQLLQLFDRLALLLGELLRHRRNDRDEQVALAAARDVGHAPVLRASAREPLAVPSGTCSASSPSSVGTFTEPPSASVVNGTRSSQWRSSSWRWKNG